ncbi:MAG: hypothetical protein FWD01_02385, partial [Defluviitaleaceae bacterium]|nr:hypothetical protein [Defluviitaleaceae bacterium]
MALINCPECERAGVSSEAKSCPGCGYHFKREGECHRCGSFEITLIKRSPGNSGVVYYSHECAKC